MSERRLDVITLAGLVVDCIVGVYPHERDAPQPLQVDLELFLDTRPAAAGGGLPATVDYARLCGELRFVLESARFLLLETAADALCRYLLAPPTDDVPHAPIEAVALTLRKPLALGGGAVPSLTVHRQRDEVKIEAEHKPFGRVDLVHVGKECGIYRLRVAPGKAIPTHVHKVMEERELVLGDGLLLQGKPVAAGTGLTWPKGFSHRYDNPSATEQTVLCVDRPAFLPDDEIEVEAELSTLSLPPLVSYYPPG
jgi:FolB domain-containing protein